MTRMLIAFVLLQAVGGLFAGDGKKAGRQGNTLYENQQYEQAADAYYAGLDAYADRTPDATYYGLQNNLGAALHKQEDFELAAETFEKALAAAETEGAVARTAYNAGNNAFLSQQLDDALAYYRHALLADPTNQDAKFNYEFVKRQMQQQQQQQSSDGENDEQEDEQNQEQQQDGEQNQDSDQQQEQQNQQPNEEQQQQDQQQQQQPQPEDSEQLSRQQAERILQALENKEEQLLREVQKMEGRPRRVEKDW